MSDSPAMARSWLIGSDSTCDLVVDHPAVSARHCRLTAVGNASYLLEDIGSTNGTFVDGRRITAPWRVDRDNLVTLGRSQPMPWPADLPAPAAPLPASGTVRIGREPDNDLVVNLPTVSGYHARVVWSGRGEAEIEDLGSSNGTAVGAPDRKAPRATLTPNDTIYLGSYPLPAARVFEVLEAQSGGRPATIPETVARVTTAVPSGESSEGPSQGWDRSQPGGIRESRRDACGPGSAPPAKATFGSIVAEDWSPPWKPLLFLALGPLAGVLVVTSAGLDPESLSRSAERATAAQTLATLLSRLGLATVVLGLLIGVGAGAGTPPASGLRRWLVRALTAAAIGLVAGLLEWATFRGVSGVAAWWGPATLGLLWLGSGVGLTIGLMVAAVAPRPAVAWAVVALLAIPLWGLGGESTVWRRLPGWAKGVAGFSPSRWTFEGLLLIAAERVPVPAGAKAVTGAGPRGDLAEADFPVETDRTGPLAVTLALGAMLLGWAAGAGFIAAERPAPAPAPAPVLAPAVGRPAP